MDSPTGITLERVAADPAVLDSLPRQTQLALYKQTSLAEAALRALLISASAMGNGDTSAIDDLPVIGLSQAASLLATTEDTLYRKWRSLSFAYKDRLDGHIKFHRAGLAAYVRRHQKPPL